MKVSKRIHIQAISSDIGFRLAEFWIAQGNSVFGTYRTMNEKVASLIDQGVQVTECNLNEPVSIDTFSDWVSNRQPWDTFVLAAGTLEPIGMFTEIDIDSWEASVYQNFVGQFRLLHQVLRSRNLSGPHPPVVLMFAGGGTNSATARYSAYTVSKIACIKMCELLDAEVPDTIFTILGPGWVDTKIHRATIMAGEELAGTNYLRTVEMTGSDKCNPIENVLNCCDWLINSPRGVVGGRNFSEVHDPWELDTINIIESDPNIYRLRRYGNTHFVDQE